MTNAKNRKLLAVLLALALLSLSVMALGGTFASQVDKNDEEKQLAEGQDFNVSVIYSTDGENYNSDFLTTPVFTAQTPWCPGYTKVVYLKVTNNEKFPVECVMTVDVNNDVLGSVMSYAVIDKQQASAASKPTDWATFASQAQNKGHLSDNPAPTIFHISASDPLDTGDDNSRYFVLAIHMDETANDTHQKQSMNMTFNLRINADYNTGYDPSTDTNTPN